MLEALLVGVLLVGPCLLGARGLVLEIRLLVGQERPQRLRLLALSLLELGR